MNIKQQIKQIIVEDIDIVVDRIMNFVAKEMATRDQEIVSLRGRLKARDEIRAANSELGDIEGGE